MIRLQDKVFQEHGGPDKYLSKVYDTKAINYRVMASLPCEMLFKMFRMSSKFSFFLHTCLFMQDKMMDFAQWIDDLCPMNTRQLYLLIFFDTE